MFRTVISAAVLRSLFKDCFDHRILCPQIYASALHKGQSNFAAVINKTYRVKIRANRLAFTMAADTLPDPFQLLHPYAFQFAFQFECDLLRRRFDRDS